MGLIYMANNIQRFAEHPAAEAIINTFRYNLRDIPRVNYKEISSDEELESEFEEESENEPVAELRGRRDPISISRIVGEALD